MRLTNKLFAQHIGWHFKKHWQTQGKQVIRDTGATAEMQRLGIPITSVETILKEKVEPKRVEGLQFKYALNAVDPDWKENPCYKYTDANVLLEGLTQAQVLTKTIVIDGFPNNIKGTIDKIKFPSYLKSKLENSILLAHVFDAEQVKLPKIKIPERPAYNLPRNIGISQERQFRLLINVLISECEKLSKRSLTSRRRLIDNAGICTTLPKGNDLLQFAVNIEKMIISTLPIEPLTTKCDNLLPDIHPIKSTVTIPKTNIYSDKPFYPLSNKFQHSHPHTIILNFNKEHVGNLHDTKVSTSQFESRTLLKAFAVAAGHAQQLYGESAFSSLDKPIVVQTIQTDGRLFHFGVFQLNTLDINGDGDLKNYFFHQESMELFKECGYRMGSPYLAGYNENVFKYLNAFYNNF